MCDLFWILLTLQFCHDLEPVGHLLAVTFFDSGEVGFAGRIFRHSEILQLMRVNQELLVIPALKWLTFLTTEVIEVDCPAFVVTALSFTESLKPPFSKVSPTPTSMIELVPEDVERMFVIIPEQAPVASVHVPEHF